MNEVLDIDGNAWCIMPRGACLGHPTTKAGFGRTIAEAEADYREDIRPSVFGNLPKDLEPLVYEGFSGIPLQEPNISFVGYMHRDRLLRIGYTNGKYYNFQDVPEDIWLELLISDSKGRFLAQSIRGHFRYYCVNGD